MFLELHIIQSFGPSVLNRDDTNTPKTAEFGGVTRARVSSQCLKRLTREHYERALGLSAESVITSSPFTRVAQTLRDAHGRDYDDARRVAATAFAQAGFDVESEKGAFSLAAPARFGVADLDAIAKLLADEPTWDALSAAFTAAAGAAKGGKKTVDPMTLISGDTSGTSRSIRDLALQNTNLGVALFGRMIAMKKAAAKTSSDETNDEDKAAETAKTSLIDAACSVAHAISTHRAVAEFDFFTAVDAYAETTGAGMMGDIPFNSATYYRVVALDLHEMRKRLTGDVDFDAALRAFLEATILLAPQAKQATFLANEVPSLVLAVVRDDQPQTLANAFERPVRPAPEGGFIEPSVRALGAHWAAARTAYGDAGIRGVTAFSPLSDDLLGSLEAVAVRPFDQFIEEAMRLATSDRTTEA
jgi:CRISPR system Cascade subunit CasC